MIDLEKILRSGNIFYLKIFAYIKKKQYLRGHRHGIKPSLKVRSRFAEYIGKCGCFLP